jgi:hypothetical protein
MGYIMIVPWTEYCPIALASCVQSSLCCSSCAFVLFSEEVTSSAGKVHFQAKKVKLYALDTLQHSTNLMITTASCNKLRMIASTPREQGWRLYRTHRYRHNKDTAEALNDLVRGDTIAQL